MRAVFIPETKFATIIPLIYTIMDSEKIIRTYSMLVAKPVVVYSELRYTITPFSFTG
jgi:hypothetical protein